MKTPLRFHILSDQFSSPNGRAFVFPLLVNANRLKRRGVALRPFSQLGGKLTDCDILAVDSKFFRSWWGAKPAETLDTIANLARSRPLMWFDTTDSAGGIKTEVLPLVSAYYKNQLYRDRTVYLRGLYGLRLYTDIYHRTAGIDDGNPAWSSPVPEQYQHKLKVGWNSGLSDYSLLGPYVLRIAELLRLPALLHYPNNFASPYAQRGNAVACRFGISYDRATVSYQRREIKSRLGAVLPTDKLNRFDYFRELRNSRVIVSPFGLGEITLKDFEVFLTGGMLLKPSMHPIETWPHIFRDNDTMLPFSWDLSDLQQQLDRAIAEPDLCKTIAANGQAAYRHFIASDDGHAEFCDRLVSMIGEAFTASRA